MDKIFEMLFGFMFVVIGLMIIGAIIAYPVMWLWNGLMPVIFGLPIITAWQALGLTILSGFLFKSGTMPVTPKK